MGFIKHKRPVLAPGGQFTAGTTFAGAVNITGALTASGTVAVSGAQTVTATQTYSGAGYVENVQTLTGESTGTEVTNYGITVITVESSADGTVAATLPFTLANPEPGVAKFIIVDNNSTKIIHVRTGSSATASNFYGSTKNALSWTTGGTGSPPSAELIGISTLQWAIKGYVSTSTEIADHVTVVGATA